MIRDYLKLVAWLEKKADKGCLNRDPDEEISAYELAEDHGFKMAINQTVEYMSQLMESWPDELTHMNSSSPKTVKE